jgi:hypothetical protein
MLLSGRIQAQKVASSQFFRSVINMAPGACVMQSGSRARSIAACGVTPHA